MNETLVAALMEIERHVGHGGWDQPARLFALVPTVELLAAEPGLLDTLGGKSRPHDALSAIEQDEFHSGADLVGDLARIVWPTSVVGCAVSVERAFVPPDVEPDIPEDADAAAAFVARHELHQDVRVVVGVLRDGSRHGVARLSAQPDDLLGGEDLVPGLAAALARTLN